MTIKLEDTWIWDKAKELYNESPGFIRAYHTFQHAQDVLNRVDEVERTIGFVDYESVRVAALFHDVVYIPGSTDSEHLSAKVMVDIMTDPNHGLPHITLGDVERARSLIIFTNNHMSHRNFYTEWDTMLFLDCDMLGFGLGWDEYQKNNDEIDREFRSAKNFNEEKYKKGRIEFLKSLYQKGIFRSPYFRKLYENKALLNLQRYLRDYFGVTV